MSDSFIRILILDVNMNTKIMFRVELEKRIELQTIKSTILFARSMSMPTRAKRDFFLKDFEKSEELLKQMKIRLEQMNNQ